ncbi:MAG: hypothetical protein V1691_03655 [Chloroflexota bacterium]
MTWPKEPEKKPYADSGADGETPFQRHDRRMRVFRMAHPRIETQLSQDAPAIWPGLITIWPVKPDESWQN